ncbi:hypothetical protein [Leifsonia shinshuensis]|uniref:hypothetical protein n=1 Tax=Leifsonia shinshuensis TaxID=150026 RepID=UPI00285A0B12|nr:hypothetical protein [Leifsonia shinshuensis]MDR6972719.1 hypothetical protein [Leifsonia shinshuensis]
MLKNLVKTSRTLAGRHKKQLFTEGESHNQHRRPRNGTEEKKAQAEARQEQRRR